MKDSYSSPKSALDRFETTLNDIFDKVCQELRPRVPHLAVILCVTMMVLIPFKIISYGYLPSDDALRHCAKAVSGKSWSEILVLNPTFKVDVHQGWHTTLETIHNLFGAGTDGLVLISVITLALLFLLPPLFRGKYPEAWITALLLYCLIAPSFVARIHIGRPYLIQMAMIVFFCAVWRRFKEPAEHLPSIIIFGLLTAVSVWMRSTWYLYSLPAFALILSREWKATIVFGTVVVAGSIAGALATGAPVQFLSQGIIFMVHAAMRDIPTHLMVMEMQPFMGRSTILLMLGGVFLWCRRNPNFSTRKTFDNPIFYLLVVTWLLGFIASKFWLEFGTVAALVWMQSLITDRLENLPQYPFESGLRLAVVAFLCAAFLLVCTVNWEGRWSRALQREYLEAENSEHRPWLPEENGILYSANMGIFYQTFFKNPHGDWKYILGFEAGLMPEEDQEIYHKIIRNRYATKAYLPWVEKMRPQDRLVLRRSASNRPDIPKLEWNYTATNTWCGRLPAKEEQAPKESDQSSSSNEQ